MSSVRNDPRVIDRIRPKCECHGRDTFFRKIESRPLLDAPKEATIAHFACKFSKPWHYEYRLWPDGRTVMKLGSGRYKWYAENGHLVETKSRHPEAMASTQVRQSLSEGLKRACGKPGRRERMKKEGSAVGKIPITARA